MSAVTRLLFWRRPDERLRAFAETEAFGARDLAHAAETVRDPWLRRQLIRHAQDEVRHAELLAEGTPRPTPTGLGASMVGATPGSAAADIQAMGEVRFIAFVHMAERRAAEEFARHHVDLGDRGAVFGRILDDERRHVAWTGHALDRYRTEGRGAEVNAAMRALRWARVRDAWMWAARRISLVMSTLVLGIVYYVVLAPFVLLAPRRTRGWAPGQAVRLERQF